jgi:hypothetical protein
MLDRRTLLMATTLVPLTARMAGPAAAAGAAETPVGPTILTVSGSIDRFNDKGVFRFDRAMLEDLGITRFKTSTAWTPDSPEFEGVLVRDILHAVGAHGAEVTATALNDYVVTIPTEELSRYPVLLALKMNGEYLKVKDKGPIWIVYPRDAFPELQTPMTDKKWIWQLSQLSIL